MHTAGGPRGACRGLAGGLPQAILTNVIGLRWLPFDTIGLPVPTPPRSAGALTPTLTPPFSHVPPPLPPARTPAGFAGLHRGLPGRAGSFAGRSILLRRRRSPAASAGRAVRHRLASSWCAGVGPVGVEGSASRRHLPPHECHDSLPYRVRQPGPRRHDDRQFRVTPRVVARVGLSRWGGGSRAECTGFCSALSKKPRFSRGLSG